MKLLRCLPRSCLCYPIGLALFSIALSIGRFDRSWTPFVFVLLACPFLCVAYYDIALRGQHWLAYVTFVPLGLVGLSLALPMGAILDWYWQPSAPPDGLLMRIKTAHGNVVFGAAVIHVISLWIRSGSSPSTPENGSHADTTP